VFLGLISALRSSAACVAWMLSTTYRMRLLFQQYLRLHHAAVPNKEKNHSARKIFANATLATGVSSEAKTSIVSAECIFSPVVRFYGNIFASAAVVTRHLHGLALIPTPSKNWP